MGRRTRTTMEQIRDGALHQVGADRSSGMAALDDASFLDQVHEQHSEKQDVGESTVAPNLLLWNGRAHCMVFEFKRDRVISDAHES